MGTIAGNDVRFLEAMTRASLLFDRGVAAYRYKMPPVGTEPVIAALRLCGVKVARKVSSSGGRNAWTVRRSATVLQALHYFRSMVDGNHLDHIDALQKVADSDPSGYDGATWVFGYHSTPFTAPNRLPGKPSSGVRSGLCRCSRTTS